MNEVLREWESFVNRVAKSGVGDKMIVGGRAARWWIKERMSLRREIIRRLLKVEKIHGMTTVDFIEK